VNGVKTGYTGEAGYVLVASATRKGVTLVSALLGAPNEGARDAGTEALLRFGFSLYERRTPVRAGEPLAEPDLRYRETALPLIADGAVRITVRRGQAVETRVEAPTEVEGPVRRGDPLGKATVLVDGEPVGKVDLVAARAASGPSFLDRLDSAVPGPRWAAVAAPAALGAALVIAAATMVGRRRYPRTAA
jgi:D-alanyl-D-alanine carboxypeptidase (penicillin-binding protein 5/6)